VTPSAWSHLSTAEALQRARTLDALAGPDGVVCGAAADHRDALRAVLEKRGLELRDDEVGALKARVAGALAPAATMILLDVELGAPAAIAGGTLPGTTALVVPLELGGYGDVARVEETQLMPGWSPEAARHLGAAACKLLLPYRADVPEQAVRQEAVVARCAAACRSAGTVLVLEPIVYRRPGEELAGERFGELVVEGARRLAALDPGLLKLQHPGGGGACRELDAACGPGTPWVLLGGGAEEEALHAQLEEACAAGASGFIVGRTLWGDALVHDPAEQERALQERAVPRLERISALARRLATPWRQRVGAFETPPPDPFGASA
jgi:tagatose-1,6-bisphosphate aldolase